MGIIRIPYSTAAREGKGCARAKTTYILWIWWAPYSDSREKWQGVTDDCHVTSCQRVRGLKAQREGL